MKIQCNGCEVAEANVLCCADRAALCWNCDQKVHAANKLASNHQRVPLSSSLARMPNCDICQEAEGFFFCLEDRALLCRKCDVAIHTVNPLVLAHQRFLLTGVKVGLEATEPRPTSSAEKAHSSEKMSESEPCSVSTRMAIEPLDGQHIHAGLGDQLSSSKLSFAPTGSVSQWQLEEFLGLDDFNPNYNFVGNDPYKADGGKFGDSYCSPAVRAADGILGCDECMDLVPDAFWAVPQIASPRTSSALYWPKNDQNPLDCVVSVPEIGTSELQSFYPHQHQADTTSSKRRRQL